MAVTHTQHTSTQHTHTPNMRTRPTRSGRTIDHLRAEGVSRVYGDRRVLTDLSITVDRTDRVGLIGENGVGKSTLLRILAGVEQPDAGVVARPSDTGFLWQEVQFDPRDTLDELIESALSVPRAIERELESAADAYGREGSDGGDRPAVDETSHAAIRYSNAVEAAEAAEIWGLESRRDELLAGLGVDGIPLDRRLDSVSGGQRARFALAALLLARPFALVLDEPTNHLDDRATEFLRHTLIAWSGPVLFASHDRAFLDEVATAIVDIDPSRGGVRRFGRARIDRTDLSQIAATRAAASQAAAFQTTRDEASSRDVVTGTYTAYLAEKAAERERWERQFADEQQQLVRLKVGVDVTAREVAPGRARSDGDKMGYDFHGGKLQKQISRRVRNAQGKLDDLEQNQVSKPPALLEFAGIPHGANLLEGEKALLELENATVTDRLDTVTLRIERGTSLLITGANGAGKSTLLGVLAGLVPLDGGSLQRRTGLRVALLEQDVRFDEPGQSPRELYRRAIGERRADAVPLASLGLVAGRDLDQPVGALSIGGQRRLALALIIARPPHLLLLDEPTNHLSLGLASDLEDAIGSYPGAVVVASHDRWLRRRWSGSRASLVEGTFGAQN